MDFFMFYFVYTVFNKLKNTDSENVPIQIHDFECQLCPQT